MAKKKKKKNKEVVEEKPTEKKRGGNHPKHPKCPSCGKALYKTMEKGKPVKKTDPFAFCRREDCKLYAINQTSQQSIEDNENESEERLFVPFDDAFEDARIDYRFSQ